MKLKKIFSMMMVGVVTFMVAASTEISNKVMGYSHLGQVKNYFHDLYAAIMLQGENAWLCMTHWLLAHGYLEAEGTNRNRAYAEAEAAAQSRQMKFICEQSGVVVDLKQAMRAVIVNEKMYRGSG